MASSWLEQYTADLDRIMSSPAAASRNRPAQSTVFDLMAMRGKTPGLYATAAMAPRPQGGFAGVAGEAKNKILGGGSRILDLLSRFNYASAGMVSEASKETGTLDILKAGWAGLSGKKKLTYSDVLREQGVTGPLQGIAGFGLDVLLDPTTYIGAGLIKAGIKGGVKGTGKVFGQDWSDVKLGRAKNKVELLGTNKVVDPGTEIKPKDTPDTIEEVAPGKEMPYEVEPPAAITNVSRLLEAPPQTTFIAGPGGVEYKPWYNAAERAKASVALEAAKRGRAEILQRVETRRYPEKFEVEPLRQTVTEDMPFAVPKTRMEPNELYGQAGKDSVRADVQRLVPENFNQANRTFSLLGHMSHGKPIQVAPAVISDMIRTGKVPEEYSSRYIAVEGQKVPLKDYVAEAKSRFDKAEIEDKPFKNVNYTEVEMRPTERRRNLTPTQRAAWIAKHQSMMDPEDMRELIRASNLGDKQYEKAFEKIKNKSFYKDYDTIEELREAERTGMITETGRQVLATRYRTHGVRHATAITKRIEKFERALARASAAPTPKNIAEVRKAEQDIALADAANKKAGRPTITMENAADDIMQTPALVDNAAMRVQNAMEHGDIASFTKARAKLTEWQAKTLEKLLPDVAREELTRPGKAPYETATRAKREVPAGKEGEAWNKGFNKYSQLTLGKKIINAAGNKLKSSNVKPEDMPAAKYDLVMPMLQAAEAIFRQNNVPLILGKGATGLPMSIHDTLDALPREFVEKYFFSGTDVAKGARSLDITQVADIVEQYLLKGLGHRDSDITRAALKGLLTNPTRKGKGQSALNLSIKANKDLDAVADEFDAAFEAASPKLLETLANNSALNSIEAGLETKALTDAAMRAFNQVFTNPNSTVGQIIRASLSSNKVINATSKLMRKPPSAIAEETAEVAAKAHIADSVPVPIMASYSRVARASQKKAAEVAKLSVKLSEDANVEANRILEILDPERTYNLGAEAEFSFGARIFRTIAPHLGNEGVRPIMARRLSVNQTNAKRYTGLLNKINSRHTPEALTEAFRRLQLGEEIDNPAMQDLWTAMREIFDQDPEFGILRRNAITAEELTAKLERHKVPNKFKLDEDNIDQSWKSWTDVEDPLDLMSRFNAAVFAVVAEKEFGAEITRLFSERVPGATGKWVKIVDKEGKSEIAKYLDPDRYYPEDIARQLHMADLSLKELAKPVSQSKFWKTFDTITHSYKAGVTIYRPGHHMRNLMGDVWLNSQDHVSYSAYKRAWAVVNTRKGHYKDFDTQRALQDAYKAEGVGPKTIVTMMFNGKEVHLSPDQIYRMAYDNGILPDYSVLEDIAFGTTADANKVAETLKKISPAKGKIHNVATTASEVRDHYIRLSHFIHVLDQNKRLLKGADLEEALMNVSALAADRVRKWHPDGSDLTHMERNVMRRGILFYSWIRKAIPLVAESMVTRPGRFMYYPKAMQNWAASNGIDLEGQSGFPEDQLFPDFIADGVQGPQWGALAGGYMGLKPGVPGIEVLDEYVSTPTNTFRAVMGGLNPLFRVPGEVATGHSMRTGGPIMDKTDYVDQLIPGGSYVSKLAGGRSLSSVFSQPTRVAASNVGYEPNFPGGKGGIDFMNWLTGLGVTDYSIPSHQKAAQIEQGRQG